MSIDVGERSDAPRSRTRPVGGPTDIPPRGWLRSLRRVKQEAKRHNVALLAGGVAFFGILALVPMLVAALSVWGLFADPADAQQLVQDLAASFPRSARRLLDQQLTGIVKRSDAGLGITAGLTLAVALWSASSGMKHLMEAVNAAYDEAESRGFVRVRGLAIALTLGAIAFLLVTVGLIVVLPTAIEDRGLGDSAVTIIQAASWPVLGITMMLGLAVVYRFAPDRRPEPAWRWVSPGAVFATLAWLVASGLFALYASNIGDYDKTYGSLGGVVVLMLWMFITALVIILGAALNASLERHEGRGQAA